jgi:hypothetical protein
MLARKDWRYDSTWLSFHCGNLVAADHQSLDQGSLTINRGPDALLAMAYAIGQVQVPLCDKSKYSNTLIVDDGGAGEQVYRFGQGVWYGEPGCAMRHFEGAAGYAYVQGDYAAAYRANNGRTNPATELTRSVFYVRDADYVVVYDRAATTRPEYLKQIRWHFLNTANVSLDQAACSWSAAVGPSKLFGRTFSGIPIAAALATVTVNRTPFKQLTTGAAGPASSLRYVTALQVAPSSSNAMDSSIRVASADGKVEGVRVGSHVVLFGRDGAVAGATAYTLTAAAAGQVLTHHVTDLAPGQAYALTGADRPSAVASPQGVLTFTAVGAGNGGAQAITCRPVGTTTGGP